MPRGPGRRAGARSQKAASHGIAIMRAYGSTEHPPVTGCMFDDPAEQRHGTDGRPLTGVEMQLLDEDGKPVPTGQAGEILVAVRTSASATRTRRSHRTPSTTPTAGTARATWVSSTPTAS